MTVNGKSARSTPSSPNNPNGRERVHETPCHPNPDLPRGSSRLRCGTERVGAREFMVDLSGTKGRQGSAESLGRHQLPHGQVDVSDFLSYPFRGEFTDEFYEYGCVAARSGQRWHLDCSDDNEGWLSFKGRKYLRPRALSEAKAEKFLLRGFSSSFGFRWRASTNRFIWCLDRKKRHVRGCTMLSWDFAHLRYFARARVRALPLGGAIVRFRFKRVNRLCLFTSYGHVGSAFIGSAANESKSEPVSSAGKDSR